MVLSNAPSNLCPRRERFDKGDYVFGNGESFLEVSCSSGFLRGRTILYKYSPDLNEARINRQLPEEEKRGLRGEIIGRFPGVNIKELEDP